MARLDKVGLPEKTRLDEVDPDVPPVEKPVILLKHVRLDEEQFVPP